MAILYLNVVFLLLSKCSAQKIENPTSICDTGMDTCTTCFRQLVNSAITSEKNQFKMQEAFFPPEFANPVYVVVNYSFDGIAEKRTWYWSESQYYASFHPLPVYQFTSLFFGDFKFRTKVLELTLAAECLGASDDFMKLLTQRLKLYAMKRSIYPRIDDSYEPKAESATTITNYHNSLKASMLLLIGQLFIFPIAGGVFIALLIHYYTKLYITEQLTDSADQQDKETEDQENDIKAKLSVVVTLSYMFSSYSFIMSIIAVIYAWMPNQDLHEWYEQVKVIRVIPILMFLQDFIILCCLVAYSLCLSVYSKCRCECTASKRCTCLGLRLTRDKKCICDRDSLKSVWKYSVYCAVFPGFNLAIHGFDIMIALIHNEVHATSVGVAYVALILINVYTLRALYKAKIVKSCRGFCKCCCCEDKPDLEKDDEDDIHYKDKKCSLHRQFVGRIAIFFLVSVFITFICGFIAAIYIIIPINSAFDKASSSLRIIYSVAIFGFTVFVTYWLLKKAKK